MLPKINTYSFFIPWTANLPAGTDVYKATIPLEEPREFYLEDMSIMYPAIGAAAPTTFNNLKFNVRDIRRKYERFYDPITVLNYTTPGVYENFGLNARPQNQQWLLGKTFKMLFAKRNSIELTITNFIGAGNPGTVEIVFFGNYFLSRSEIVSG